MTEITIELIKKMVVAAVEMIRSNHEHLSKLDSAIGDGDHGTTMLRAMNSADKIIKESSDDKIGPLLYNIGWGIMCIDGGSTGPLLGSLFMGMSKTAGEKESLGAVEIAQMFQAGLDGLRKNTKAQPGDKTMIDALVPAIDAINLSAEKGDSDIAQIFLLAAQAAKDGADSTKDMKAAFGRAKNLGDRTIGHLDPGASSIAYIFEGFSKAVADSQ